jgi:hypothetical protein
MIDKKDIGWLYGILLATFYATLTTGIVYKVRHLHLTLVIVIFICLWIGFYFTGVWIVVDRPAELEKKFPISSREHRRRKKEFFDSLDSDNH